VADLRPRRSSSQLVQWLYDLRHFGIKLGLDNIRSLLAILGHPEHAFRSVHIAGTNGKGSTSAMLDALLRAHGIGSGMFSSPHLVRPNERIRIHGEDISDAELDRTLGSLRGRIADALGVGSLQAHPSFFETMTAAALTAFKARQVEAAVLEVGLGGRLDATNAVAADVSVIVNIDLDHTKTLGPTLEHIAREKGGIVKPQTPLVHGVQQPEALDVLTSICTKHRTRMIDARCDHAADRFGLETADREYPDLHLSLVGRHQVDNARVALAAFETWMQRMGRPVDADAVRQGFATVRWPGRLQRIEAHGDLPAMLLDAAHNPAGLQALVHHLESVEKPPAAMLFGATSGKPLDQLLEPLSHFVDTIIITEPPVDRGLPPEEVAPVAEKYFSRVICEADVDRALRRLAGSCDASEYALVAGSLYLIGTVLGLLNDRQAPGPVAL